jgi:hypothetical protein
LLSPYLGLLKIVAVPLYGREYFGIIEKLKVGEAVSDSLEIERGNRIMGSI